MGNTRRSRVCCSILPMRILPLIFLWFFAKASDIASRFLAAEPPSRTATSPPESSIRTSWSAASPPPIFISFHLLSSSQAPYPLPQRRRGVRSFRCSAPPTAIRCAGFAVGFGNELPGRKFHLLLTPPPLGHLNIMFHLGPVFLNGFAHSNLLPRLPDLPVDVRQLSV